MFVVRFSPISLLYGKPKISELTLIAPRLELVKDKDGEWNLHRYIAGRKGGNEIRRYDVMVHETYIRDAEIRITDKKKNTVKVTGSISGLPAGMDWDSAYDDVSGLVQFQRDAQYFPPKGYKDHK